MSTFRSSSAAPLTKLEGWQQFNSWATQLYGLSASLRHLKYCNPLEDDDKVSALPEEPQWDDSVTPTSENFGAIATLYQIRERQFSQVANADVVITSAIKASLSDAIATRVYHGIPPATAKELVARIKKIAKPDTGIAKESAQAAYTKLLQAPVPVGDIKRTKVWWELWIRAEQELRDSKALCSARWATNSSPRHGPSTPSGTVRRRTKSMKGAKRMPYWTTSGTWSDALRNSQSWSKQPVRERKWPWQR